MGKTQLSQSGDDVCSKKEESSVSSEETKTPLPVWRFWLLSVGISLGLFLSIIDASIVATSLYTIGNDLDAVGSINWVALSYTLAYLGCAVAFARASDVIGRRNAFIAAYILFFAFSMGCGFAQNINQLIAFRSVQGVGGSGLYSLSMIILPETCPKHLLQFIGALIGLVIAGSGVLGPVLGGILTQYASWRWVFWINGPIGVVSLAIFLLSWPRENSIPQPDRRSWKTFDYVGTILVVAAAVLVVFAFQNAGESFNNVWSSGVFLGPLISGVFCWIAVIAWGFVVESQTWALHLAPAFPMSLFRNRFYTSGALATLFIGFPYFILIFSFPMRAQIVSSRSALEGGIRLLPMLGATAFGTAVGGKINSKKNWLFQTLSVGAALMVLGCGLLTTVHGPEDDAKAMGFLAFAGLGFGLSTTAATILVSLEAPIKDASPGHGILAQMRILGGSLGISTSTVLVRNEVRAKLGSIFSPEHSRALGNLGDSLNAAERDILRQIYSEAFHKGMLAATAVAAGGFLLALLGYRPTGQDVEEQRAALIKHEERRKASQLASSNSE